MANRIKNRLHFVIQIQRSRRILIVSGIYGIARTVSVRVVQALLGVGDAVVVAVGVDEVGVAVLVASTELVEVEEVGEEVGNKTFCDIGSGRDASS